MIQPNRIGSPHDAALGELCKQLRAAAGDLVGTSTWPAQQLAWCAEAGVFGWFVSKQVGGQGWSSPDICRGYLALSSACMTTTFVITQFMGACQRIASCGNTALIDRWIADMLKGERFGTIGISHLTTSRRHLSTPVLRAENMDGVFQLDGYSPWVTGASRADVIVTGATLAGGEQILVAVETKSAGVTVADPQSLVALAASRTGPVHFHEVCTGVDQLLAGPERDIMKRGGGGNTGGLQTSALALGLASSALDYLRTEAGGRDDLMQPTEALRSEWNTLVANLLSLADGVRVCSTEQLRARANSLVLRATQAALVAAKGAGFVEGHPAGRWCREAFFFLVWSCPQNVLNSNLCELAGISD
jgi:alkylation response protein AidB-like acyl-CoA dehydrogenase